MRKWKGIEAYQDARLISARRSDGSLLGDVIPLENVRTLINLVPRFGKAERRLTKENLLECSEEFWLNHYFEKELFYALNL